jgi:hypothetical protein
LSRRLPDASLRHSAPRATRPSALDARAVESLAARSPPPPPPRANDEATEAADEVDESDGRRLRPRPPARRI